MRKSRSVAQCQGKESPQPWGLSLPGAPFPVAPLGPLAAAELRVNKLSNRGQLLAKASGQLAALLPHTHLRHLVLGSAGAPQLWGRWGAHPTLESRCQSRMDISAASPGRHKQLQEQGALDRRRALIVPMLWEGPFCLSGCSSHSHRDEDSP